MAIDDFKNIPNQWIEDNGERLVAIYEKIKDFYWVGWCAGYEWRFGHKKPKISRRGRMTNVDWKKPTFAQVMVRQYNFDHPKPEFDEEISF